MPQTASTESTSLRVKLKLSDEILAEYERKASDMGISLDTLVSRKLSESAKWNAQIPLYLSDDDRKTLEKILGHNFNSTTTLIDSVRRLALIKIEHVPITLREEVLARLRSRCPRAEPVENYIERTLTMLLEQFVGLR